MILRKAIEKWRASDTYKKQGQIHWFVWLLENPSSPISLTGAVDLYNHDIIHILLNRGMEVKDEAMVIGFTMGNSKSTSSWVRWLFEYGYTRKKRNIHIAKFDPKKDIVKIRKDWGINIKKVL